MPISSRADLIGAAVRPGAATAARGALIFALALLLLTGVSARADVPEEAEADFVRGVAAASLGDYVAASEHFQHANAAASGSPTIHFNLGLAQAQIAGRELSATCWLGAYLAAEPFSRLRPSIETVLDGLQAEHRRNVVAMIELYEKLAEVRPKAAQEHRDDAYTDAARFWLRAGEVERAKAALARVTTPTSRAVKIGEQITSGATPRAYRDNRYDELFKTPYETHSQWQLVWRWAMQASEAEQRHNAERAKAWADACRGVTESKPMLWDTMVYVRQVGQGATAAEVAGAWNVVNTLEDAIDEIITVGDVEAYHLQKVRMLGVVPWISISAMAAVLAIFAAALVFILFDVIFRRARSFAMPVTLQGFFFALVGAPLAVAGSLYLPISIADAIINEWPVTIGDWIGFVFGVGMGLLFMFLCVTGAILSLAAILVKLSGRALPPTKATAS